MAGSPTGLPAHCFGQAREEFRTAELLLFVKTSTLLLTPAGGIIRASPLFEKD